MSTTPDFRIETTESATHLEIRVRGEVDSATATSLAEHFERAAARTTGELVVDLRGVSFIDSAGIRTMVLMQRTAAERGLALVVRPPPEPVMELLQLSGVAERLTLAPHDDDRSDDGAYRERCDLRLACEPAAPSRARARLRHAVGEHLPSAALDAAILLTSELVTNAVIHPEHADDDVVTLAITTYEDRLRVEVSDSGSGFDPATPRPAHETGGRGLFLVDALANRWGTRRSDPGQRFTVWFELDAAGDPADAVAAGAS